MDLEENIEVREGVDRETVETVQNMGSYKYGWETDIEMDYAPKGVNEDIVRLISEKNGEPQWMTDWRLAAFRRWRQMEEPRWAMVSYPAIDYQDQYYYAKPKSMAEKPKSLADVDPKLLATCEKLGIPLKAGACEPPDRDRGVGLHDAAPDESRRKIRRRDLQQLHCRRCSAAPRWRARARRWRRRRRIGKAKLQFSDCAGAFGPPLPFRDFRRGADPPDAGARRQNPAMETECLPSSLPIGQDGPLWGSGGEQGVSRPHLVRRLPVAKVVRPECDGRRTEPQCEDDKA